jgi:hypothetical protein
LSGAKFQIHRELSKPSHTDESQLGAEPRQFFLVVHSIYNRRRPRPTKPPQESALSLSIRNSRHTVCQRACFQPYTTDTFGDLEGKALYLAWWHSFAMASVLIKASILIDRSCRSYPLINLQHWKLPPQSTYSIDSELLDTKIGTRISFSAYRKAAHAYYIYHEWPAPVLVLKRTYALWIHVLCLI